MMDKETLSAMKNAGCKWIYFGVESSSKEILDELDKKITIPEVEETVQRTKQHGIGPELAFLFGAPGETKKTMEDTIEFAKRLDPERAYFYALTPYPGTHIYNHAQELGIEIIDNDWTHYNSFLPVHNGKYMTRDEILMGLRKAYMEFYAQPEYASRYIAHGALRTVVQKIEFLKFINEIGKEGMKVMRCM